MEGLRGRIGWWAAAAALTFAMVLTMPPEASAMRYVVGANMGWMPNVNYTVWAQGKHFYLGDWLFFVYDRNEMNVLEVKRKDYENCISDHPVHNWTSGAGRDVVPLNVTRAHYFISGKGFCSRGMKVAVHVEKPPPPPASSPQTNDYPVYDQEKPPPSPTSSPASSPRPTFLPASSPLPTFPPASSPPPTSLPQTGDSAGLMPNSIRGQILVPVLVAAAAISYSYERQRQIREVGRLLFTLKKLKKFQKRFVTFCTIDC